MINIKATQDHDSVFIIVDVQGKEDVIKLNKDLVALQKTLKGTKNYFYLIPIIERLSQAVLDFEINKPNAAK